MIQLWAVIIIGLPVSLVRLLCEVGLPSLCTLSSLSCGVGFSSRKSSQFVIIVKNRFLSWPSSVWESVMVVYS